MSPHSEAPLDSTLHDRAYAAFDEGGLTEAAQSFAELLQLRPEAAHYHYMQGLVHKYRCDWTTSLHHNLRALALDDENDVSALWNAGIAATGLGDWTEARKLWTQCGIKLPDGDGPIDGDFGVASIRLNPSSGGETVFARRIDVVRARLLNVPFPESGYRFGDIVLHDGASTGQRWDGDREVSVFNALARMQPSDFRTHVVFVSCNSEADIRSLLDTNVPGVGHAEDWTASVTHYCLRCSYGTPHRHSTNDGAESWQRDRNLGIAAQSRLSVEKLLKNWKAAGSGRRLEGIETRDCEVPEVVEGSAWWIGPEAEEKTEAD